MEKTCEGWSTDWDEVHEYTKGTRFLCPPYIHIHNFLWGYFFHKPGRLSLSTHPRLWQSFLPFLVCLFWVVRYGFLQPRDHKTSRLCLFRGRNGFSPQKKVHVQSHNSFLDQSSQTHFCTVWKPCPLAITCSTAVMPAMQTSRVWFDYQDLSCRVFREQSGIAHKNIRRLLRQEFSFLFSDFRTCIWHCQGCQVHAGTLPPQWTCVQHQDGQHISADSNHWNVQVSVKSHQKMELRESTWMHDISCCLSLVLFHQTMHEAQAEGWLSFVEETS